MKTGNVAYPCASAKRSVRHGTLFRRAIAYVLQVGTKLLPLIKK